MAPVIGIEFRADGVGGLRLIMRPTGVGLRQGTPVTARPPQVIVAKSAKQYVIWPEVLGMLFKALPLEILGQIGLPGIRVDFGLGGGDRIAKDGQATVLAPKLGEASVDAVLDRRGCFWETDAVV